MILFNGPNTPFGRMALVVALELGLGVENRIVAVASATELDALNPLRQIPTLLLGDGTAVFDSRVICTHLAAMVPGQRLIPNDLSTMTRWALIVGLMDAAVGRQMERRRPVAQQSAVALAAFERRIAATLTRLEQDAEVLCDGFARIDRLAAAVALGYIDFRYPHPWREGAPRVAAWLATVAERPSMAATRPREAS